MPALSSPSIQNTYSRIFGAEVRTILQTYGISQAYVFGSYPNGTATLESDVDILVYPAQPMSFRTYMHLKYALQEELGCVVDVVLADAIKGFAKDTIDKSKKIIFSSGYES